MALVLKTSKKFTLMLTPLSVKTLHSHLPTNLRIGNQKVSNTKLRGLPTQNVKPTLPPKSKSSRLAAVHKKRMTKRKNKFLLLAFSWPLKNILPCIYTLQSFNTLCMMIMRHLRDSDMFIISSGCVYYDSFYPMQERCLSWAISLFAPLSICRTV